MKYINENSNRGLVNLFSDYIVNQINKDKQYDVVIEVTDDDTNNKKGKIYLCF
jgi:hypothetical protein